MWIQGYFNRAGVQREETLTAWTSGIRHALVDGSTLETATPGVESSHVYEPLMSPDVLPEEPPPANDVPLPEASPAREPHIITFEEGSENSPPELLTVEGLETFELPTNEGFETLIRKHLSPQRFSPQRVNTALQILHKNFSCLTSQTPPL